MEVRLRGGTDSSRTVLGGGGATPQHRRHFSCDFNSDVVMSMYGCLRSAELFDASKISTPRKVAPSDCRTDPTVATPSCSEPLDEAKVPFIPPSAADTDGSTSMASVFDFVMLVSFFDKFVWYASTIAVPVVPALTPD